MPLIRAIDADGHVQEPAAAWETHLDARYRALAPRVLRDDQGRVRQMIGGELKPYIPVPASGDWEIPAGGHDPKLRLADMDRQGIDASVLFPTFGLMFAGLQRTDVHVALCRAYNDWLRGFCGADPKRLLGIAAVPQHDLLESLAEARRCVRELGFRGVMMRPNHNYVYQILVGATGQFVGDWTWDAYASYGRYDNTDHQYSGFSSKQALRSVYTAADGGASQCPGGYNPFANGLVSRPCVTYLTRQIQSFSESELTNVEVSSQGGLFDLPAGRVRAAVGVGYRENAFVYRPDDELITGDFGDPVSPIDGSIAVYEGFVETLIPLLRDLPLIDELTANLGYRYSDYDTIGSVSTYKVNTAWRITAPLMLRGGYQKSIRAPNIGQMFSDAVVKSTNLGRVDLGAGDPCDVTSPSALVLTAIRYVRYVSD